MIDGALAFMRGRLDRALGSAFPSEQGWVRLAPLTTLDGLAAQDTTDKILLSLVNIQRDASATRTMPQTTPDEASVLRTNPTLQLSLDVLVSARFEGANYADGLMLLSGAISYFQGTSHYTRSEAPDLPQGVDRLSLDWVDLDLQAIHNLWTGLGGQYLPSVLYRVRLLGVQSGRVLGDTPIIRGVGLDVDPEDAP